MDGYVIDLVRDSLLVEIQTSGFSSMKAKVAALVEFGHRVRIVHPIAVDRWIVKVDGDTTISRRRSPKHGLASDVFAELVSFPDLLTHPLLEIHVLLTEEEEQRRHVPGRSWRRRGWTTEERRLLDVVDTLLITGVDDLADLLPSGLPEPFTTADLAAGLGRSRRAAQQMTYCLRSVGAIDAVGKEGNAIQYRVA